MSSRGQGRGVLRPLPTDCVPSKILDPGGVEPFGLATTGSLKKLHAVRTKRMAGRALQKADPLHSDFCLLTPDFCLSNPRRRKRNNAPLRDAPASMTPGRSSTLSNPGVR